MKVLEKEIIRKLISKNKVKLLSYNLKDNFNNNSNNSVFVVIEYCKYN